MIGSQSRLPLQVLVIWLSVAVSLQAASSDQTQAVSEKRQETATEKAKEDQPQSSEPSEIKAKEEPSSDKDQVRRKAIKRWYLGARPGLPALKGPSVGKPTSIIPQPFVAPGKEAVEKALSAQQSVNDGAAVGSSDYDGSLDVTPELENDSVDPIGQLAEEVLEAAELSLPDPSIESVSVAGSALVSRRRDPFRLSADRETLTALFNTLNEQRTGQSLSLSLDQALRLLATAPLDTVASTNSEEIATLAIARLTLLQSLGDQAGYRAFLASLSSDERLEPYLAKKMAEFALLSADIGGACDISARRQQADSDIFWTQIAIVCAAALGDRAATDFQLSLLEEVATVAASFYSLTNQILLEAEAERLGSPAPDMPFLRDPLMINPLNVAMARLARVTIEDSQFDGQYPLALLEAIELPTFSDNARLKLMGEAVGRGLIAPERLGAFFKATPVALSSAPDATDLSDFSVDTALGHAALVGMDLEERLDAAARLWQRAEQKGTACLYAVVLNNALREIPADARLGAQLSTLMRIALMAGDQDRAKALFLAQRTRTKGEDLVADESLILSIPLSVALDIAPEELLTIERLEDSIQVNGYAKTSLLLTVMEGLGTGIVSEQQWDTLDGVDRLESRAVNPVRWRRFLNAVARQDQLAVIRLLPRLVASMQAGDVDPAFAGSFAAGLQALGFDQLAHGLMRENLLLAGF